MDGIGFKNFRVFRDKVLFDFAPITILTGANSSGKTTIIKGLKLLQEFWAQDGFGHLLNFENGNHHLGNFDMCLSKKSKATEFTVSYKIRHIAFEEFAVDLTFQRNDANVLKNGVLREAVIRAKDGTAIFSVSIVDNERVYSVYNYEYIIDVIIPKLHELLTSEEWKNYSENVIEYIAAIEDAREYGVDIGEMPKPPAIAKIFTEDFKPEDVMERQLQEWLLIENSKTSEPSYWATEKDPLMNQYAGGSYIDFNIEEILPPYNLEVIKIFNKMSKSDFKLFAENLWAIIVKDYPDISELYDYLKFKKFIDDNKEDWWVDDFLKSPQDSFIEFYNALIKRALHSISQNDTTQPFLQLSDKIIVPFYKVDFQTYQKDCNIHTQVVKYNEHRYNIEYKIQSLFSYYIYSLRLKSINAELTEDEENIAFAHGFVENASQFNEKFTKDDISNNKELDKLLLQIKQFLVKVTYKAIKKDAEEMYFINSIRADSQRFYSFNSHDSEFHAFILEFLKRSLSAEEQAFIRKWLKEFEIADDVHIDITEGAGSKILLVNGRTKTNLVDLGYGVTQFLPIALKIAYCHNIGKKIIVIEEPETNLHPKFQSMLADMFVDANKTFGIQFVVETHSEYLVRKLQYLTANKNITPDDTVIHYIGNPDKTKRAKGEKQVRTIHIEPTGRLSQPFGSGFYDEADNLSLQLLEIS